MQPLPEPRKKHTNHQEQRSDEPIHGRTTLGGEASTDRCQPKPRAKTRNSVDPRKHNSRGRLQLQLIHTHPEKSERTRAKDRENRAWDREGDPSEPRRAGAPETARPEKQGPPSQQERRRPRPGSAIHAGPAPASCGGEGSCGLRPGSAPVARKVLNSLL
jgi:hypothetical protein